MVHPKKTSRKAAIRPGRRVSEKKDLEGRKTERLDLIEELILAEGFSKLTVDSLAARLKCSKRSLYELAPTKNDLALLILARLLERVSHAGVQGALNENDPKQRLIAYMRPGFMEAGRVSRQLAEDLMSYPPTRRLIERHQRERVRMLQDLIEDGIRRGSFRKLNAQAVAEIYLAALTAVNDTQLQNRVKLGMGAVFRETFELIVYGICPNEEIGKENHDL